MTKPLIDAALGIKPQRLPIWFLRQAGRYLPEYQKIRRNTDFVELCRTPRLAATVTLQPLGRFDLDGAIIFSDILIPCMAMGQKLSFGSGHGPILTEPIRTGRDLLNLKKPAVDQELGYVGEAIILAKEGLSQDQAMIGFAGAPFTVACYMVEGGASPKNFLHLKRLRYTEPDVFTKLLELISATTIDYLLMQVKCGADCLMLFDTWANQLPMGDFRELIFPHLLAIVDSVKRASSVPIIYYPGSDGLLYYELTGLNVDVIAIDWRVRMDRAQSIFKSIGLDVGIQGNLDPGVLLGRKEIIREKTVATLKLASSARSHIFNVGHGLLPDTPIDSIHCVIDEIRKAE